MGDAISGVASGTADGMVGGTASDQVKTNDNQEDGQMKEAIMEQAPNKYPTSTQQASNIQS